MAHNREFPLLGKDESGVRCVGNSRNVRTKPLGLKV